jgi:hypothetical protein
MLYAHLHRYESPCANPENDDLLRELLFLYDELVFQNPMKGKQTSYPQNECSENLKVPAKRSRCEIWNNRNPSLRCEVMKRERRPRAPQRDNNLIFLPSLPSSKTENPNESSDIVPEVCSSEESFQMLTTRPDKQTE